jgi:hypothetical protein
MFPSLSFPHYSTDRLLKARYRSIYHLIIGRQRETQVARQFYKGSRQAEYVVVGK